MALVTSEMGPVELGNFARCSKAARALALDEMGCTLERLAPVMNQSELTAKLGLSVEQAKQLPYEEVVKHGYMYRNTTHVFQMKEAMPVLVANIGWSGIAECIEKRKCQDAKLAELNERRKGVVQERRAQLEKFLGEPLDSWLSKGGTCPFLVRQFLKNTLVAPEFEAVQTSILHENSRRAQLRAETLERRRKVEGLSLIHI